MPRSQHAELFNLIEYDGPHVSIPVLDRVFPQGFDAHDPNHFRNLRAAYEEWDDDKDNPAIHRAWVEFVLRESLGYPEDALLEGAAIPPGLETRVAEHGETLRPDFVLVNPKGRDGADKPRMLIRVLPPDQDLSKPEQGSRWKASPDTRMMILCKAANVPLGLITNGEQWMLVYAPPDETTGYTSWYAHLWLEEPLTFRAWRSLLGTRRFFGVADADTLECMLAESAKNQQEVTDQLGLQVRESVELFVETLDRIDIENGRKILADVAPEELYEASLTVMMRLVFLFCAEERDLLLLGDPVYDQFYAVSTLSAQLREVADQHGEEILERRCDAWSRLLATFRAVYGGVQHENLRLTAYGGSLFDPDRFPFLEGRPKGTNWAENAGRPLTVDNRTVLHLMEALQFLQLGGERQRLSFRALGIEQIGHVYEGLLDHTVFRAPDGETILSLKGAKDMQPEIAVSRLEAQLAKGESQFVAYLSEETGRSETAIRNALGMGTGPGKRASGKKRKEAEPSLFSDSQTKETGAASALDADILNRLRVACANNEATLKRVLPFAGLIREDSFGHLVVINGGSFYVTQGSERRKTGTHYTPRSLTEPIVQYTLEPLVYEGPAEGWDREKWKLRSAAEILALKICDMAMGSGAFLVQTVRYLGERLVEAWDLAEQQFLNHECAQMDADGEETALGKAARAVLVRPSSRKLADKLTQIDTSSESGIRVHPCPSVVPNVRITPEGLPATGDPREQIVPTDPDERMLYARRIVCDRCIYGVDINPLAVEMAKLSLWLVTMGKGRAFTFLNHALKCGDSLLGLWDVEQIHRFHLDTSAPVQAGLWGDHVRGVFEHAMVKRRELESFSVVDVRDAEAKARLLAEADRAMEVVRILCDLLIAGAISTADGNSQRRGKILPDAFDKYRDRIFDRLMEANSRAEIESAVEAVRALLPEGRESLNTGNPNPKNPRRPFHWTIEFPEIFLTRTCTGRSNPGFSAIVGNPPFQGGQKITGTIGTDYRNYCIDTLACGQRGSADLCAYFFLRAGQLLSSVSGFGLLATNTIAQGDTREVGLNQLVTLGCVIRRAISSQKWPGSANLEVAHVWISKGLWCGAVTLDDTITQAIGPDLCSVATATLTPKVLANNSNLSFKGVEVNGTGFIVESDFALSIIARCPAYSAVLQPYLIADDLNSRPDHSPTRWVINFHDWPLDHIDSPHNYNGPVATDFPECLDIVSKHVRPQRMKNKVEGLSHRWWLYKRTAPGLSQAIQDMRQVLVCPIVTKHLSFVFCDTKWLFTKQVIVFPFAKCCYFALLQSSMHESWARKYSSTLETRLSYAPSDCFETFPFPELISNLEDVGRCYYEHREATAFSSHAGLTSLYNQFNDPETSSNVLKELRSLHAEMDRSVADAYGWTDLDLGHDFHETKQGIRFTVSESARREILDRLLALNHQRYAEEVAQGLHDKGSKTKGSKSARKKAKADEEAQLF